MPGLWVPLEAALNTRALAQGCCQPRQCFPWLEAAAVFCGWGPMAAWSVLPVSLSARGVLLGIAAIRPCGVKPTTAELEQIQMLNRFKEVMIYWLDLIN